MTRVVGVMPGRSAWMRFFIVRSAEKRGCGEPQPNGFRGGAESVQIRVISGGVPALTGIEFFGALTTQLTDKSVCHPKC